MKVHEFFDWLKTQDPDDEIYVLTKRENSFYETVSWEEFDVEKHVSKPFKDCIYLGSEQENNREQ